MKEKKSSLDNKCIIFITGKPIFVKNLLQFLIHLPIIRLIRINKWKHFNRMLHHFHSSKHSLNA